MEYDTPRQQTIAVFTDRADTAPAYRRTVQTHAVMFTCHSCGCVVTQQRYPGQAPCYCSTACKQEAVRDQARERMRRWRARRTAAGGAQPGSNERIVSSVSSVKRRPPGNGASAWPWPSSSRGTGNSSPSRA